MSGTDFELNLTGNSEQNALDSARALAKLTRQMKSADKQMEKLNKHAKEMGRSVGSAALLGDLNKKLQQFRTPAQRAADAARRLSAEKKTLAARQRAVAERAKLVSMRMNEGRSSMRRMGGSISALGRGARGLVKTLGLVAAAGAAIGGGMFMGGVAKKARFSQKSNNALALLTGGQESGRAAFQESVNLARQFGLNIEDTTKSMQKLLAQQFSLGESKNLIKLGADLRAIGADAQDVQGVIRALTQIRGKGRLQGDEMVQLAEAGISRELIFKSLEKQTGLDRQGVQKRQEAGNISSDMAIKAVEFAILKKTKTTQAGQAGATFATTTFDGAMGKLGSEKDNFLLQIAEGAQPAFKSLAGVMSGIADVFGDRKVIDTFTSGFKVMGEALQRMKPDLVAGFKKSLTAAADIFERLSVSGSSFFEGFFSGFSDQMDLFNSKGDDPAAVMARMNSTGKLFGEEVAKLIVALPKMITLLEKVASVSMKIASAFSVFGVGAKVDEQIKRGQSGSSLSSPAEIAKADAAFQATLDDLFNTDFFSTYEPLFQTSGANTVNGMIAGMDSRKAALQAKSAEIAAIPVNTWSNMHEEHSPSKLFERKAGNDIRGMITGYNKSSRALFGASASASAGAATAGISAASATAQRSGGLGGGGGTNVFNQSFRSDISVNESERPGQTANEIASTQSAGMFGAMVRSKVAAGIAA